MAKSKRLGLVETTQSILLLRKKNILPRVERESVRTAGEVFAEVDPRFERTLSLYSPSEKKVVGFISIETARRITAWLASR